MTGHLVKGIGPKPPIDDEQNPPCWQRHSYLLSGAGHQSPR
jgi:hypothetical protein